MKKFNTFFALACACLGLISCKSGLPAAGQVDFDDSGTVVKSQNDRRIYEYFELDNRLRVLVISDPDAKKAAVSLNVGTGSMDDPEDRQGLAHFLEHMLFLGTEKYPVAGEYQKFISGYGGAHNAYTSFEDTNYFFDINAAYLGQALDRFSQFFISPLFTEKYVGREKHAVESEYRAKYKDEARRGLDVLKEVVNPEHPFVKFSVGNLDTLADRPDSLVRDDLISFYQQHYSANRMSLVVLGSESVADLRSMVEERFAAVPDRDAQQRTIEAPLFPPGRLPVEILVTPEQDIRKLDMTFPIADPRPYWEAKPIHMIADIIGHEGEGSLLQYLKGLGYAEGLSAGEGLKYDGGATLDVSIKLTESGYAARDEVVAAVFQAVNRIAAEGINQQRFDEQSKVSDIQFRYQDKRENIHYVLGLAASMSRYPAPMLLKGPYLFDDYRPDLYQQYLAQLRPDNVLIMVTGPGLPANRSSRLYQTPYAVEPFTAPQILAWEGAGINPAIVMPEPNPFIPENFERLVTSELGRKPRQLLTEDNLRIWHGDDGQFAAPRASLRVGFFSPLANDSARHRVLLQLYAATVVDRLNPKLYPALLTGFNARLGASRRGLELGIDGFSDKQIGLFEMMLVEIQQGPIDAQRFADIKQELMRGWQNRKLQPPYRYLSERLRNLLYTPSWTEDDQLAVIAELSVEDLEQYRRAFLGKLRIEVLSYGNITAEQSAGLKSLVQPLLSRVDEVVVLPGVSLAVLPESGRWRYPLTLDHSDAAIVYYVQGKSDDNQQRALMGLTGQIVRTPYYHSLRTEQQFGYVVYASTTVFERMPGLTFIVQSPVADAATLLAASDQLLQEFDQTAQDMTVAEFEQHKEALTSLINRPHKNLAHEAGFFWEQILQHYLGFDRREQLTLAVDKIELEQWRRFYRDTLLPIPSRSLVVTQAGDHQAGPKAWSDSRLINDASSFRQIQQQRTYP